MAAEVAAFSACTQPASSLAWFSHIHLCLVTLTSPSLGTTSHCPCLNHVFLLLPNPCPLPPPHSPRFLQRVLSSSHYLPLSSPAVASASSLSLLAFSDNATLLGGAATSLGSRFP